MAGNTAVAGTLDVTGNIDPTSYESTNGGFKDEDAMTSNSATAVASQQSIKKYTDTNVGGDSPTVNDSESNAMAKDHAYLAQTSGFVTAFHTDNDSGALVGYVGSTTDPVGAGTKVGHSEGDINAENCITFFVPTGKYFELTQPNETIIITWTPLVTGGGAPVDQD
jgi:hypothetical protein